MEELPSLYDVELVWASLFGSNQLWVASDFWHQTPRQRKAVLTRQGQVHNMMCCFQGFSLAREMALDRKKFPYIFYNSMISTSELIAEYKNNFFSVCWQRQSPAAKNLNADCVKRSLRCGSEQGHSMRRLTTERQQAGVGQKIEPWCTQSGFKAIC